MNESALRIIVTTLLSYPVLWNSLYHGWHRDRHQRALNRNVRWVHRLDGERRS